MTGEEKRAAKKAAADRKRQLRQGLIGRPLRPSGAARVARRKRNKKGES